MYNNPFDIKIQKKLTDLAEVLVPETFRNEAPQYYDLVKAFLYKLQTMQNSLNVSMVDLIDPSKITSNDIANIYFNTYLAQLQLDDSKNFLAGVDMLKVAKDLSLRKGTATLYFVLINLLTFLLPGVSNSYYELIQMLQDPDLTPEERAAIEQDIANLKDAGYTGSYVEVTEDPVEPFTYEVQADIDFEAFYNFIKPFCHPAGWHIGFTQIINRYVKEKLTSRAESFNILMAFVSPTAELTNSGVVANQSLTDNLGIEGFYSPQPLGLDSEYSDLSSSFYDPSKLYTQSGNTYYDFGQITFSKFVSDLELFDFGTTATTINKQVRYIEPLWKFPSSVYYSANRAYAANTLRLVTNGGCVSNYYGRLITYKYITSRDVSLDAISDS